MTLSRRGFLEKALAAGTAVAVPSCWNSGLPRRSFQVPGEIVGGSAQIGHLLRVNHPRERFPEPEGKVLDTVIVGGGAGGLCAAWKLKKSGCDDFVLLELEPRLGGTAVSGQANGTEFPWAAHYLNIPPAEADCINEVLSDLGVIQGYDSRGFPMIPQEYLLKWPRERLFRDGKWREWNLKRGASAKDSRTLEEFEDDMLYWTLFKGRDGRRAFALPLRYSSSDPRVRKLDKISMKEYVRSKGWVSPVLDWKINYACRDDYGSTMEGVSAWAGIHYFACRNYDPRLHKEYPAETMTWPAGNGFLIHRLKQSLSSRQLRTGTVVLRIENGNGLVTVGIYDVEKQEYRSLRARTVVYAGKLHTAPFVIQEMPEDQATEIKSTLFSPWLTASIHVKRLPERGPVSPAWDNVLYESQALGYVVADHQVREQRPYRAPSVLVYYLPFVREVKRARQELLDKGHAYWVNVIMSDLLRADPELEQEVQRIDVYRWGHAMVRPQPGFLWGKGSEVRRRPVGAVFFGSCEASGLPLFEEACFSGIRAAELALHHLGLPFDSSLKGLPANAIT